MKLTHSESFGRDETHYLSRSKYTVFKELETEIGITNPKLLQGIKKVCERSATRDFVHMVEPTRSHIAVKKVCPAANIVKRRLSDFYLK